MSLRKTYNPCAGRVAREVAAFIRRSKRIVVKTGTDFSCDTHTHSLKKSHIESFVQHLPQAVRCIVASGAVCAGKKFIDNPTRAPRYSDPRRKMARRGQNLLTHAYRMAGHFLTTGSRHVRECLYTKDDINGGLIQRDFRLCSAANTLMLVNAEESAARMDANNHVPNNDILAAQTAIKIGANLLLIISKHALYDRNPSEHGAKLIHEITHMTPKIWNAAQGTNCHHATGGMATKLEAARLAAEHGISTIVLNGNDPECMEKLSRGCYDEFTFIHAHAFDHFTPTSQGVANGISPALAA